MGPFRDKSDIGSKEPPYRILEVGIVSRKSDVMGRNNHETFKQQL